MTAAIFISHSSQDVVQARQVVGSLEKRGFPCWISSRDIKPGEDFQESIVDALCAASVFLLLLSNRSVSSKETAKELSIAKTEGKTIIPVRLEAVPLAGAFKYQITSAQWIDLFAGYDEGIDRLSGALTHYVGAATRGANAATPTSTPPLRPRVTAGRVWMVATFIGALLAGGTWFVIGRSPNPAQVPDRPAVASQAPGAGIVAPPVEIQPIPAIPDIAASRPRATSPQDAAPQATLAGDIASASWAIGTIGKCRTPYTATVQDGRLVWNDGKGGTDVEQVKTTGPDVLTSQTISSSHANGRNEVPGTLWLYTRLRPGMVSIQRNTAVIGNLVRCPPR